MTKFREDGKYRLPFAKDKVAGSKIQVARIGLVSKRDKDGKVVEGAPLVREVGRDGVDPEDLLKIALEELKRQPQPSVDPDALAKIVYSDLTDEVGEPPKPKKPKVPKTKSKEG